MLTTLKSKKGTTITEIMVAILIFAIIIVGCSLLFATGGSYINVQEHHRVATHLAAQKLEQLKAGNYSDIKEGQAQEYLSLEDLPYRRSILTEDLGLYKKVTVTVYWDQTNKQHNVSLVTFIAPK